MDDNSDDEGGARVEFTTSKDLQVYPTFEAMGLKEDLLRGIYNYGAFSLISIHPPSVLSRISKQETPGGGVS